MPLNIHQRAALAGYSPVGYSQYVAEEDRLAQQQAQFEQTFQQQTNQQQWERAQAIAEMMLKQQPVETYAPGSGNLPPGIGYVRQPGQKPQVYTDPAARGPIADIDIGGPTVEYGEKPLATKTFEKIQGRMIERAESAADMAQFAAEAADMLSKAELETGSLPALSMKLQGMLKGANIDLQSLLGKVGIDIGGLEEKQMFARVAKQAMLARFEMTKGNLNDTEVRTVRGSLMNESTTVEANMDAIASIQAAAELSLKRGQEAIYATNVGELQGAWRYSSDTSEFLKLKQKYLDALMTKRANSRRPEHVPADAKYVGPRTLKNGETKNFWKDSSGRYYPE